MRWKCVDSGFLSLGLAAGMLGLFANGATRAEAQAGAQSVASPRTSLTGELQSLASRAAVVFSGQVVNVDHSGGVVAITFRVEQAVLGGVGPTFVLREWAGLWPPGQFRYHVGERALVFLHGTSAAGFASAVDGQEGIVPVEVQGANAPALLDVRRLASALQRAPGTPLSTEADGGVQLTDAIAIVQAAAEAAAPIATPRPELPRFPLRSHSPLLSPEHNQLVPSDEGTRGLQGRSAVAGRDAQVPYAAR